MSGEPRFVLPSLTPAYAEGLAGCVASVLARYDVRAVVASGTIVRGKPDPRSDFDVVVVHRGAFRQRLQEFHEGVPCEIFVNPRERILEYFEEEREARRPMTAHMIGTGFIVYDPEGVAADLQAKAREILANPPPAASPEAIVQARYHAASLLEDALDLEERDPIGAMLVLAQAALDLVECRFLAEPGWLPRPKDRMARLRELDPETARWAEAAMTVASLADRLDAGRRLCRRVTGAEGFFPWATPPGEPEEKGRLIVLCGLPGAGKTTLAKRLEGELRAIRFCPDEWMAELAINVWDEAARTRIEALQWRLAQDLLRIGHVVVIEWGTWARSERDTLRLGARALGAAVELRLLDAPIEELFERVQRRGMEDPPMTLEEMRRAAEIFQAPTPEEIALFDPPRGR